MKKLVALKLTALIALCSVVAQTPQKPQQEIAPDDIIRITTNLVQTDAVITDKNDQIISDLKLEDFELYDNGKKQDIKFLEFVANANKRVEGEAPALKNVDIPSAGLSAADLKRVVVFVVDDLTITGEDLSRVRDLLRGFVNNQMQPGDLVAIVRVIGNSDLLGQYSSDKRMLLRAIDSLTPASHPFSTSVPNFGSVDVVPRPDDSGTSTEGASGSLDAEAQTDNVNKGFRTLISLATTNSVILGLKSIPGRKSVVLISGGLPLYESNEQGTVIDRTTGETIAVQEVRPLYGDTSSLIQTIVDNAGRAGVVVNTMDVRGLQPRPGVRGFQDTEAKSGLGMTVGSASVGGGGMNPGFGRTPDVALIAGTDSLAGAEGLRAIANATGGVATINTNNFATGLDKILSRADGYYLLGYTSTEKFDAKFHKVSIKVKRDGAHIYSRAGYYAREDVAITAATTKEEAVIRAATSPLVKRELGVTSFVQHKFTPDAKAEVDIHIFIDPKTLNFTQSPDGRYKDSFDLVVFVFDSTGKARGGFSETVNTNLTAEEYKRALTTGLSDSGHTELPPGNFQLRVVVRENETGRIGTAYRYLEVPNLAKRQLTMSSLFIYGIDPTQQGPAAITPLQALRQVSRKHDLRYAAVVYNPKMDGGKPQAQTQMIITQGSKIIFQEPEQPLTGTISGAQVIKVGQLGLSKVTPGRYVLTLIVNDSVDKKARRVSRSVDFNVVD
jgi:VWFA-related protein